MGHRPDEFVAIMGDEIGRGTGDLIAMASHVSESLRGSSEDFENKVPKYVAALRVILKHWKESDSPHWKKYDDGVKMMIEGAVEMYDHRKAEDRVYKGLHHPETGWLR